jgi:hypothetical protein
MIRRCALSHRAIPLLTILLLGCTSRPTPIPTPIPPPTRTAPPTAAPIPLNAAFTATPSPPTEARPMLIATSIRFAGWSPGSIWFAYWSSIAADVPETLTFFNVATGQKCPHPDIRASVNTDFSLWESDFSFVVSHNSGTSRVTPCGSASDTIATAPQYVGSASAVSPNGLYRVDTSCGPRSAGVIMTAEDTGEVIASYPCGGGVPGTLGGQWITVDNFLINEFEDRFPVILQADGNAINVVTDLFQLPPKTEMMVNKVTTQIYFYAQGVPVTDTDEYHILFYSWLEGSDYWTVLLYHSVTGITEVVPVYSLYNNSTISPDGRSFVIGGVSNANASRETSQEWFRYFDPLASDMTPINAPYYNRSWSPDGDFMAIASTLETPPDTHSFSIIHLSHAQHIATWHTGEYLAQPIAWSPDGRWVVALGFAQDRSDALYLFAR